MPEILSKDEAKRIKIDFRASVASSATRPQVFFVGMRRSQAIQQVLPKLRKKTVFPQRTYGKPARTRILVQARFGNNGLISDRPDRHEPGEIVISPSTARIENPSSDQCTKISSLGLQRIAWLRSV